MKVAKKFLALLLTVTMVTTMMPAMAFAATGDTGTYKPYPNAAYELKYEELSDGTLKITGYKDEAVGNLVIPEAINGKYVTVIGSNAFKECSGLTGNLTIPEKVTSIETYAFYGCSGLTGRLTIPKDVTFIGYSAFNDCSGLTGNLTIPEKVTYIDSYAFCDCEGLTGNLIIPNGVTRLGTNVFDGCKGFNGELKISEKLTEIRPYTFRNCTRLRGNLIIPKGVTSIGAFAFSSCYGLTGNLTIPEGVKTIDDDAFSYCYGFTGKLTIPEGVTYIGRYAFNDCIGLTGNLTIPESVTSIDSYAFASCRGLTGNVNIPGKITVIEKNVFSGCSGLTGNVIIPEGITSIGEEAFYGCSGLTGNFTLPRSLKSMGNMALGENINNIEYNGSEKEWNAIEGRPLNVSGNIYFKNTEINEPADYSKVDAALAKIPADLGKYTEKSAKAVTDARDSVIRNLDKKDQAKVDKMANDIETAIKNLTEKADYSKVDAALDKIPYDLSIYTSETADAVNKAKNAVKHDLDITKQAEVDKMAKNLEDAIAGLKIKKADYSKVDAALDKIPKNLSIYTDETVKAVIDAKNAVVRNLDITKQAEVDNMAADINDAVMALEVKDGYEPIGNIGTVSLSSYFYKVNDVTFRGAYNGNQMKAIPIVKNEQGEVLKDGVDYEVTYSSDKRVAVGAYKFTVTGIGLYIGEITCKLIITPKAVANVNVRHGAYSGGYDDAYVTWNKSVGADGYYVYMRRPNIKDNAWVSLGTVKGTSLLKKDLADGYKYEFKVLPYVQDNMKYRTTGKFKVADMQTLMKAKINTAKKYNNERTRLTWTNVKGVTGYQVMVSAKGNTRYFTINSPAANAKVIKNAKTSFKVRAYKDVKNNSGKTVRVYAPWSDARSFTLR